MISKGIGVTKRIKIRTERKVAPGILSNVLSRMKKSRAGNTDDDGMVRKEGPQRL
ncbi:hypothetical protein I7I51_05723 [Histoplasma capsulatum]|uniref:Uncharacterized protein n=1 Tax=Ajellomyces capsulatus TaxID=5037 RepID=A0A8A1M396_AJECA|nr:hypothetical protein I7I51_05723 [Histoplasma capsulatum]